MNVLRPLLMGVLTLALQTARADWPEFRGPWGNGYAAAPGDNKPAGLPLRWSETENIKWKTEIPYRGWSTPVVLGDQVWLTTATEDGHDFYVMCVDANIGKVRFNEKIFHCDNPEPLGNAVNGYASSSPAIEPGRVYVHFGCYGTACLDPQTCKVIWQRQDLPCRHYRGPASSLVIFEKLLILTMDGADLQYLVALDKQTGKTVWKTNRSVKFNDAEGFQKFAKDGDLRKAHSTPFIANVNGQPQMFSPGAKAAYAYDPRTGRELWMVRFVAWSAAPRPLYNQGRCLFITGSGATELWAVRLGGQGDVTDSHVVWKYDKHVARTASPIIVDDLIYMVSDGGDLTCLEVATGKLVWKEKIGGNYAGSPIYADGRLYFPNQQSKTTVVKPGRSFEVLAVNVLEKGCMASPAVSGKAIFLRTKGHLYRIEDTSAGKK